MKTTINHRGSQKTAPQDQELRKAHELFDDAMDQEAETCSDFVFVMNREREIPAPQEYLQELCEQGLVAGI